MKKTFGIFIIFILSAHALFAQNEIDALRYSETFHGGSARFMSMGGAFNALGGDISSLTFNPAGIAVYQRSEMSITPTVYYNQSASSYMGSNLKEDNRYNFNLNNIGVVAAYKSGDNEGWANVNFGVGYNRKNNFNRNMLFEGYNTESSMLDLFADNATAGVWGDFENLAYEGDLLFDTLADVGQLDRYYNDMMYNGVYGLQQRKVISTEGSMGEFAFSFGANYAHKIYFGLTFGIQQLRYEENYTYSEEDIDDQLGYFRRYNLKQNLETVGTGFNFKFGVIARPVEWFRIGGAVHTPTFFNLQDDWSRRLSSYFDPDGGWDVEPYGGTYDYELQTPFRAMGGVGFVVAKTGIISFDYEFVDYSSARLRSDVDVFADANDNIRNYYTTANIFRAGAEYRVGPISLRGGFSFYDTPYVSTAEREDGAMMSYSGGLGINSGNFYFDLGYVYSVTNETQYVYPVYENQSLTRADTESTSSRILATMGIRF